MKNNVLDTDAIERLLNELVEGQKKALLTLGRRIVPTLTMEDMLQPNDYPNLEHHPEFRYEEGVLAGLQAAQMAMRVEARLPVHG
jgi:hypothetical protein